MKQVIDVADRLGEVKEYYFSIKLKQLAEMRREGVNVINMGIGSPDMAPHKGVLDTLNQTSTDAGNHAYQSYSGIPELRRAFANWYSAYFGVKLNPDTEILPLIGSKEGIMHIAMTYLQEGDEVLLPNPGYPTYRSASKLTGARLRDYDLKEENNWLPDLDKLEAAGLDKVKIMWVNYPHMPTGSKGSATFFEKLIALAKKYHFLIVNDNPYAFVLNDEPMSILSIPGAKEVALELNSLSKSHNMAGWRVGMVAGDEHYIKNVLRFKSNMDSGMFKPVQLAAVKALSLSKEWYNHLNEQYRKRRKIIFELADIIGCSYDENQVGLFVWAKVPKAYKDGYSLSDEILDRTGVFITPGGVFGSAGNQYIRFSLCNDIKILEEAKIRIGKPVCR